MQLTELNANIQVRLGIFLPFLVITYPLLWWPLMFSAGRQGTGTGTALLNIEASESNSINVIYFLLAGVLFAIGLARRRSFWARVPVNLVICSIFAYILLAGLSTTWALEPAISFRRYVQQVIIVAAVLIASCAERSSQPLIRVVTGVMTTVICINLVWLFVKPSTPLGVEGIYPHKNTLGAAILITLPFIAYSWLTSTGRSRHISAATMLAAIGLLLLSQSKTSYGVAIVSPLLALATVWLASKTKVPTILLFSIIVSIGISVIGTTAVFTGLDLGSVSMFLFGDPTFTGRTFIWQFVAQEAAERPLLGHGFNSFWAIGFESPSVRSAPGFIVSLLQAHNGYWDVRLETGFIGLMLLLAILIAGITQAMRLARVARPISWLSLTLIYTAILHNVLESSFFRGFNLMWIAFLLGLYLSFPSKETASA